MMREESWWGVMKEEGGWECWWGGTRGRVGGV